MYPKVELTDEEKLNYINNLLVAGTELIGKTEVPVPQSTDTLTSKEQDLQNKVAMLQRHNDLLMNEIDRKRVACGK